jgi:basic amino acid/polyamine antiporter, APA family
MSIKEIFRKKSFEELSKEADSSKGLIRSMEVFQLILLGIGAIIGGGVFVLTGTAAFNHAGPAIVLSFALSGVVCICAGLCYAEFASMIPVSGSSYTYAYATLGELPAWLIGCFSILAYFLSATSVANGWSSYFVGLLEHYDIYLPERFTHVTGHLYNDSNGEMKEALFNLPAFLISIATMLVLCRGTQGSSIINAIIVFIKMAILFLFIAIGATKIDFGNWIPFIPENTGTFGEYGISGIVAGVSIVFLAFNGFDSVCTAAQEAKNPQKNLPIGIIGAIIIATITYILVGAVLTGVVSYKDLNTAQPFAIAAKKMNSPIFLVFVKLGAVAAITSVILVHQYAIVRMIYSITKDGLLPSIFKKIHKKYHTPYFATIVVGLLMGIVGATIELEEIVKLSTFFILLTIMVICFSTIYLRYKRPDLKRNFKCPFVPWVPMIAILLAGQILFSYPAITIKYALICLVICTIYYLSYGKYKSNLEK